MCFDKSRYIGEKSLKSLSRSVEWERKLIVYVFLHSRSFHAYLYIGNFYGIKVIYFHV